MSNEQVHPVFQPLLNAISRPVMRIECYICHGTGLGAGSFYGDNVEVNCPPCSRCGGERFIEVRG